MDAPVSNDTGTSKHAEITCIDSFSMQPLLGVFIIWGMELEEALWEWDNGKEDI